MDFRGRSGNGVTIKRMLQTGVDGARKMEQSGLGSVLLLFRCMIHADMTSPGA